MRLRKFIPLFIALAFLGLSILPDKVVTAQQPTPSDDQVNAIASQLFCPVCENTPLDVCPTQACHDWRELIRQMLAEGKTSAEIKQYFVDHYGARVLSVPPQKGLSWFVYIIPPLAFLAGILILIKAFRSWKKIPTQPPEPVEEINLSTASDDYTARIEEELRKRD